MRGELTRRRGRRALAWCLVVVLLAVAWRTRAGDDAEGEAAQPSLVDQLDIAAELPDAGYERALFEHWVDADGDGCSTREEVLIAESRTPAQVDPFGCQVVAGDWLSPYDGYATDDPAELEVDHVVALAEAWRSGASRWDAARRRAFANDLDEAGALVAVTAAMNRIKGDRDPAEWQPPSRAAWCEFAAGWVRTKAKWGLTADAAEARALRNLLDGCSGTG